MSIYEGQFDESIRWLPTSSPVPLLPTGMYIEKNEEPEPSKTFGKLPTSGSWWNTMLITSCVIAVSFDPLFFYIPFTSDERKCIGRDRQVQTIALILRSLTDIGYIVHIVYRLQVAIKFGLSGVITRDEILLIKYESVFRKQMAQFVTAFSYKLSLRSFLTDLLCILPLPQVLIVGSFFKIGGSDYLFKRKIVSGFVIIQYVPRVYRIHLSSPAVMESKSWIRGLFNLFLYILASHILGAFWYFFAIQRETSCWYQNCIGNNNTESMCTFYCHGDTTAALITPQFKATLDEQCLLKVPYNMTDPPFDFGIFFDVLKNDIQRKINFPQKISYCFWWGLRNLSNFGTSLETSTYMWENIFAVVISIVGLLLFLYLIGTGCTLQGLMERAATTAEEVRDKLWKKRKDIENWMKDLGLSDDMKKEIWERIIQKLHDDPSADLDGLYFLLPNYTKEIVKREIGIRTMGKVPILRDVDMKVLKLMCDYMKLVKYEENKIIFETGDPIDRVVFVIQGIMHKFSNRNDGSPSAADAGEAETTIRQSEVIEPDVIKAGESYATEVLLHYASSYTNQPPTFKGTLKCNTKVEVLILKATDLRNIAIRCRSQDLWPDFPNPQTIRWRRSP